LNLNDDGVIEIEITGGQIRDMSTSVILGYACAWEGCGGFINAAELRRSMALSTPDDLVEGRSYRIVNGPGEGEQGRCEAVNTSNFGLKWGQIKTPTGSYWTRWQLLEAVDGRPQ
jgi:hypothetical protein